MISQINLLFHQAAQSTFCEKMDLFAISPNLRVVNRQRYHTLIGLFLSLVLGTLMVTYLISDFMTMISKTQPSIYISEQQIFDTSPYPLNNDNFTIAVSTSDVNNNLIIGQGKYYEISINQCIRERIPDENGKITISQNCTELPIETCTLDHFTTDVQKEYFGKLKLGSLQCINRDALQNNPPVLKGQFSAYDTQYLLIYLKICQNTTDTQTCAPIEEINEVLSTVHYNVYSSEYLLKQNQPGIPYEQIIVAYYSTFSITTSKRLLQYYQIIQTTTDKGLVTEELYTETNLKQSGYTELTDMYNDEYIIEHWIILDYKQTNYYRNYVKLQTILGKLGGMWQITIIILSLILRPFVTNNMNFQIAQKIFRFQNENLQANLQQKIIQPSNQAKFKMGCKQQLLTLFGCDKKGKEMLDLANQEILQHLDIVHLMKKLQELELLKYLLLNEEQLELFNIIPKPSIQQLTKKKNNKNQVSQMIKSGSTSQKIELYNNQINQTNSICKKSTRRELYSSMLLKNKQQTDLELKLLSLIDKKHLPTLQGHQMTSKNKSYSFLQSQPLEDIIEPFPQVPK